MDIRYRTHRNRVTPNNAKEILASIVKEIGLGFHADTLFTEYVNPQVSVYFL